MNIPNSLTILRIFLVPFFLIFILVDSIQNFMIALIIFFVASMTDFLDGYIARKYNLITNFGKLIDPLADKILTSSAFIALAYIGLINPWLVIIMLSREFVVSGFSTLAASGGKVVPANFHGKMKTVLQVATIGIALLSPYSEFIIKFYLIDIFAWASTIISITSALGYLVADKDLVKSKKI